MNNILVSTIIPTYNRAGVVGNAIDSVLGQTYRAIEVIVIDDGSTDETQNVLRRYGTRIRVVRQQNSGPAAARNRGISEASGEMIAFLDSDDIWLPTKLQKQVELLEKAGSLTPCCLCNCSVLHRDRRSTSTFDIADTVSQIPAGLWLNPAEVLTNRFVLFNQAAVIRRPVLERIGYFDESLKFGEDYELPLRLSLEGPWTIIQEELVLYHASSPGSWAEKAMREEVRLREDLLHMRERMLSLIDGKTVEPRLRRLGRQELRRARRELSLAHVRALQLPGLPTLHRLLTLIERFRKALFRRTPMYPRMLVQSLT